jgi:hypothetical protein
MDREALLRGIGRNASPADVYLGVSLRNERRPNMSSDDLKRKIRNFPVANLGQRIAAAS